jgi:hypothetical protein
MRPRVTVSSRRHHISATHSEEWAAMDRARESLEHDGYAVKLLGTDDRAQWLHHGVLRTPPTVKLTIALDSADVFEGRAAPLLADWIESNVRSLIQQCRIYAQTATGTVYVTIKQPVGKQWGSISVVYECQVTVLIF